MGSRKVLLRVDKKPAEPGRTVLEVRNLNVVDSRKCHRVKDVSFTVRAGEIVGIAGVSGNGQSELLGALAGTQPVTSGSVLVNGSATTAIAGRDARAMRRLGMAHVPEDRHREGLVTSFLARDRKSAV